MISSNRQAYAKLDNLFKKYYICKDYVIVIPLGMQNCGAVVMAPETTYPPFDSQPKQASLLSKKTIVSQWKPQHC
jgi:hypothetical protein